MWLLAKKLKARIQASNKGSKGHQGSGWLPGRRQFHLGTIWFFQYPLVQLQPHHSEPAAGSVKQLLDHGGVDGGAPHPLVDKWAEAPAEDHKFEPRCERTASEARPRRNQRPMLLEDGPVPDQQIGPQRAGNTGGAPRTDSKRFLTPALTRIRCAKRTGCALPVPQRKSPSSGLQVIVRATC